MYFLKPEEIDKKELIPGCEASLIHSENMTVIHWQLEQGARIPEHAHPHEQVSYGLEGEFEFSIGERTERFGPGHAAVIPPNTVHSGRAVSPCRIIDVFYPVREDYR